MLQTQQYKSFGDGMVVILVTFSTKDKVIKSVTIENDSQNGFWFRVIDGDGRSFEDTVAGGEVEVYAVPRRFRAYYNPDSYEIVHPATFEYRYPA